MFESFLKCTDDHPGWAAWVQAIGVFGSIWVVVYFSHRNEVRRRKAELHRAKGVLTHLKSVLGRLRVKLNQVEAAPFKKKKIWLSNKMIQRSRDLHLLGNVGTDVDLLVEQLGSLNDSIAALPTEQSFDPEQRLQAEADIKEGVSSCRQLLESILVETEEKELSDKKPFVVRRVIDPIQRFFGSNPSV